MTDKLAKIDEQEQLETCMAYLIFRDAGMTQKAIADEWDITTRAVQYRLQSWKESGIYEAARAQFLAVHDEEFEASLLKVRAKVREVIAEYPSILGQMVKIAKGEIPAQPRTRWEIAAWLEERFVAPAMEEMEDEGRKESAYAQELEENFDPINITEDQTVFVPKKSDA